MVEDLEEPAEVLEEDDEPKWVPEHKKVVFSAIDYSLKAIAEERQKHEKEVEEKKVQEEQVLDISGKSD